MANPKGVVRDGWEAGMAKWVEVVGRGYFGKDSRNEVVLGHVEEIAVACNCVKSMPDVVGIRGAGEHEGRLEAGSVC